jgi:hypothetical protein
VGNQRRKAEVARRHARRRTFLSIGVVLLLVVIVSVYLFLTRDKPVTAIHEGHTSPNLAAKFEGGVPTLIYADFANNAQDLHRLDLGSKVDEGSGELPRSGNTLAAFGSSWVSIDVPQERKNGTFEPLIYLYDTETEEEVELGVGLAPMWSPDGSKVTWTKPQDPDSCGATKCRSDVIVMVTEPGTGQSTELSDPGPYETMGWAGEYVILHKQVKGEPGILQSLSPEGDVIDLPLLPVDYWGASPDGRYLVQNSDQGARFLKFEDGNVTGPGEDIGIPPNTRLGVGTWSHDSATVAAFALGDNGLELVTFSPSAPEPVTVADGGSTSTGEAGKALWSPDNDAVVFQRITDEGTEFEAVYCPLDPIGECETVLTWSQGLTALRIE